MAPVRSRGCCGGRLNTHRALHSVKAVKDFLQMIRSGATVLDYRRAFGFDPDDIEHHLGKLDMYRVISKAADKIALIVNSKGQGEKLTEDEKAEVARLRKLMWRSSNLDEV